MRRARAAADGRRACGRLSRAAPLANAAALMLASPVRADPAHRAILSTQAAIDAAMMANDPARLAPLLARDATRTGATGVLTPREEWLAQMRRGAIRHGAVRRPPPAIRIHGDTAIVTGLVQLQVARPGAAPAIERNRYPRVFVREDGGWKLAAREATAMATVLPARALIKGDAR
jgi:ketosteroid isomerase-like protein